MMPTSGRWGVWSLRSHLSALLVLNIVLTLGVAGAAVLLYRIPQIEQATQQALHEEAREMRDRLERMLRAHQARLELMSALLAEAPARRAHSVIDLGGRSGDFRVVYRVSPQGRILALGAAESQGAARSELVGSDLSSNSLFQAAAVAQGVAWSGRHLSLLTGQPTAGVAYRARSDDLLMAEVPVAALLDTVEAAAGGRSRAIWVVDRAGEIIADTVGRHDMGQINIRNWALMESMQARLDAPQRFQLHGTDHRAAAAHSSELDWYFIAHAPIGLANPDVRDAVLAVLATVCGGVLVGLLVAPYWARRMGRPLQPILARAGETLHASTQGAFWPQGSVAEFNRLALHLGAMANTLREREQKFLAIFNGSPVPMVVTDARNGYRLVDANEAWCRTMMHRREDVLGRTAVELKVFTAQERAALAVPAPGSRLQTEILARRSDGAVLTLRSFGQQVELGHERWLIWASIDIGPMRRVEHELRALNQLLEVRVHARAKALARSNAELSQTVGRLRDAQQELVRAGKMAALGSLVAGVAHELNTPLGNGVLAVGGMADAAQRLRAAMQGGLKRADLQRLVHSLEQGADIAGRNLRRAAALVHSFKQVAVDQTSEQRRRFELAEVVHEMVVSLRPSFARQPWQIDVQVPAQGLELDSYPGALGQALGNLIQNAVVHGFEGREHGRVSITAGRMAHDMFWLRVADDGHGIAPEHLDRIFDPFMTTRMGRGGTGLGLHISYNAVVHLLGGQLNVRSTEGQGSCFEMRLPATAPRQLQEAAA